MKNLNRSFIKKTEISRRDFLWVASMASAGLVMGCATNPVTGRSQLMLVSETSEIQMDQKYSPQQFSTDYGILQDKVLNDYINRTGQGIAAITHRPQMPFSFQGVNATYINAYAFPGGSIAATRGILLKLENEAELGALLGHELGHVNMRHTAERMSKGVLAQAVVAGLAIYAGTRGSGYSELAGGLGMLGAGVLLASYSRENEREADALGMAYMTQSGYNPEGMVGLMDMLNNLSKKKAGAAQLLFATHPMSDERYQTAVTDSQKKYGAQKDLPLYRDRYMDHTVDLRAIQGAIEEMQKGEKALGKKKYPEAESHFRIALKQAPEDYAGLLMLSKCLLAQKKTDEALKYAEKARHVNPGEAQAMHLSGYAKIRKKQFSAAYQDFQNYQKTLPENPNTFFFKGLSLEGMQQKRRAAKEYSRYLQVVGEGEMARHAYGRLVQWGYR